MDVDVVARPCLIRYLDWKYHVSCIYYISSLKVAWKAHFSFQEFLTWHGEAITTFYHGASLGTSSRTGIGLTGGISAATAAWTWWALTPLGNMRCSLPSWKKVRKMPTQEVKEWNHHRAHFRQCKFNLHVRSEVQLQGQRMWRRTFATYQHKRLVLGRCI